MNSKSTSFSRCQKATWGMFFGLVLLIGGSASAQQNLLQNPGFESPLDPPGSPGTTNWTVIYEQGSWSDWAISDRSTFAPRPNGGGIYCAHLMQNNDGLAHTYFKQVVSGLLPGTNYTLSGWMRYYESTFELNDKFSLTFQAIGGLGTVSSVDISAMDDPNAKTNETYRQYFVTNTADANGKIEVRLRLNKVKEAVCCDKIYIINGMWDDMALTLTP